MLCEPVLHKTNDEASWNVKSSVPLNFKNVSLSTAHPEIFSCFRLKRSCRQRRTFIGLPFGVQASILEISRGASLSGPAGELRAAVSRMGQLCCCVLVHQATVGVEERWGKYEKILEPGFHCMSWCLGSKLAGILTNRVQQMTIHCETKTKDNVFVTIVVTIQYKIVLEHAREAFYKLSRPHQQIQAYVFDVVRSSVPRLKLDDVFEQKNDVAKSVEDELEKAMKTYGYEIVRTLIIDVIPDQKVKRAMNEINAAARLRVAAKEKAEAEKIVLVKLAEAEAETKFLQGQGIARQRQAIVDGLRESVLSFSDEVPDTAPKDVMDMIMVTQYFDTMKDIGDRSSSAVFIPHVPGADSGTIEQIRNGYLQGTAQSRSL